MIILVNGRPLTELVSNVLSLEPLFGPAVAVRSVAPAANSAGGVVSDTLTLQRQPLTLRVEVAGDSLVDREAHVTALARAFAGIVELEIPQLYPGRMLRVVLAGAPTPQFYGGLPANHRLVDVALTLAPVDGVWLDTEPTVVALSATEAVCPVGAVAIAPAVELFGATTPVVNPVVSVRAAGGADVGQLTCAASLAATESLEIEAGAPITARRTAGVLALDLMAYSGGESPILDPADGAPTLRLAATSGTPTGRAIYRRAW